MRVESLGGLQPCSHAFVQLCTGISLHPSVPGSDLIHDIHDVHEGKPIDGGLCNLAHDAAQAFDDSLF